MSDVPKHVKIRTFTPQPDGSVVIQSDNYVEKYAGYKQEIMKHERTSKQSLLSDILTALKPMTSELTKEVTIVVKSDDYYHPNQLTYTYIAKKEVYKPR